MNLAHCSSEYCSESTLLQFYVLIPIAFKMVKISSAFALVQFLKLFLINSKIVFVMFWSSCRTKLRQTSTSYKLSITGHLVQKYTYLYYLEPLKVLNKAVSNFSIIVHKSLSENLLCVGFRTVVRSFHWQICLASPFLRTFDIFF